MKGDARAGLPREACARCLRRGWLLARLSPLLDRVAPDRERLFALLDLEDELLIDALAGSRRASTRAEYHAFDPAARSGRAGAQAVTSCRHRGDYPGRLHATRTPRLLHVLAAAGRLRELGAGPAVALLGSESPSEYGAEVARGMARELSACAITVVCCASSGIGVAAQRGALEAGCCCIALLPDGLAASARGPYGGLLERLAREGCAISELAPEAHGRLWGRAACERLAVELAQLVVVIEGHAVPSALAPARYAQARGTILGAVPGQINSSLSGAPHTLLREGAALIGGAEDALELLHTGAEADATSLEMPRLALEPALQAVLDDVAAGRDSAQALSRHQQKPLEEVLLALTQLELMGLLARARGGRYMRRVGRAAGNRAAGS